MYKRIQNTRFNSNKRTNDLNELNENELRRLIRKEIRNAIYEGEDIEEYYDESEISEDEMLYDADEITEEEEEMTEEEEIEENYSPKFRPFRRLRRNY